MSASGKDVPEAADELKKPNSLDIEMNLNLYNFDHTDAQSYPYVLTSPHSLEACSVLGIKPVELLHKSLTEFTDELKSEISCDQVMQLYQEHEQTRVEKLEKCRLQRTYLIQTVKRSQSASPLSQRKRDNDQQNRERASIESKYNLHTSLVKEIDETLQPLSKCQQQESKHRPVSWSAPTSPYRSALLSSLVPITSPVLLSKLKDSPKVATKLHSKDIRVMELMLRKHQLHMADEMRREYVQYMWEEEMASIRKKQSAEEKERRCRLIRSKSLHREEVKDRMQGAKERMMQLQQQKRRELLDKEAKIRKSVEEQTLLMREKSAKRRERSQERKKTQELRLEEQQKMEELQAHAHLTEVVGSLEKAQENKLLMDMDAAVKVQQQNKKEEDRWKLRRAKTMYSSLCDASMQLEALHLRDQQIELRKQQMEIYRENTRRKLAETTCEKLRQAKINQKELDKSLEIWRDKVAAYQEEANCRAIRRAAENIEQRRIRLREERLTKETDHQKNYERVQAEDEARLLEAFYKISRKEKRSKMIIEEKNFAVDQARNTAQAASDLRDHLRHKMDEDALKAPKLSPRLRERASSLNRKNCLKEMRKSKSFFC